jgi:hypothetical protein
MGFVFPALVLLAVVAVTTGVAWRSAGGPDGRRRGIAAAALSTELVASLGLLLVGAQMATGGEVLCPSDAQCSAPYSAFALVATVLATRRGLRDGWEPREMAVVGAILVVAFVVLVVLGSTYRIDVPRP